MTPYLFERRLARRQHSFAEHGIVSARVRPGINVSVVDVSAAGTLIETNHRLLPGTSVEICFDQDKRLPGVRGKVVRCAVAQLGPDQVCYRGAIVFDQRLPWMADDRGHGYSLPGDERRLWRARRAPATRVAM
jgi:PilZ domain